MASIWIARKLLDQINTALKRDQGASFRQWQQRVLPHIGDAYRGYDEPFRKHLGASVMGQDCARAIWYGYRWATKPYFDGRVLRLFNRGHLEEGRFIALLLMIGVRVQQQDENGKQFRISHRNGLIGGSGDGQAVGIPDLPPGTLSGLEFKTHNDDSYKKLVKSGVREAKFEHFVQMQIYMRKMGIPVFTYMAVNKNNDDIYAEIIQLNIEMADEFLDRAERIIDGIEPPRKINNSPGYWKCKFCDHRAVCHLKQIPSVNCRTCKFGTIKNDEWRCKKFDHPLDQLNVNQMAGCSEYIMADYYG